MRSQNSLQRWVCFVLTLSIGITPMLMAQDNPAPAQTTAPPADTDKPPLQQEELEQMLAPIALYPDSLLSQIFMASTYPLEVVQADRWAKANKGLDTDAFAAELEKQDWDPSVKSLVNFPEVLGMMSDKLDMTVKLGDAFIEQQADVMNTVQVLRAKAQSQGNLKTSDQQKIIVEAAPPAPVQTTVVVQQVPAPVQIIRIEPVQPTVIYVPTYNPVVVYGGWPYPAYPPYPYYPPRPPGYVASSAIWFGIGVGCGVAWGYAWGNCNWNSHSVKINYNQNININKNINRSKYQNNINNSLPKNGGNWNHNPQHRQGVPYRDQGTAQKFGGANQSKQAAQARDAYRGRTDAGQKDLARGGASDFKGNAPNRPAGSDSQNRPGAGAGDRANSSNRPGAGAGAGVADRSTPQNRPSGGAGVGTADRSTPQNRPSGGAGVGTQDRSASQNRTPAAAPAQRPSNSGDSPLSGADRSGNAARTESQRGQSSRSSSSAARSAPSGGGGGANRGGGGAGGGASRGGGGGGGGRSR